MAVKSATPAAHSTAPEPAPAAAPPSPVTTGRQPPAWSGQAPLFIAGISRFNGKTIVKVSTHGFNSGNVGNPIRVWGCFDDSYNGTFVVATVPDANTITYAQAALNDNHIEQIGGAISIG